MRTDALDYELPAGRIATRPAEPRDAARLMVCHRDRPRGRDIEHAHVRDLPRLGVLQPGDLMLVNRTKVLPAYFEGIRAGTGGRVRGLYVESPPCGPAGETRWLVMLESRGSLQPGEQIALGDPAADVRGELLLVEPRGRGAWLVTVRSDRTTEALLERIGMTPLPPYIRKVRRQLGVEEVGADDAERYNTVYAADPGSVAAPTAGLHFTPDLLAQLTAMGVHRAAVTLNVGLGTFEPVRTDNLDEHRMHHERICIPAPTLAELHAVRQRGGRILVVGTTTARAVESLPSSSPPADAAAGWEGDTDLFIHPESGFAWRFTDALMTNFHLPRSTLLAMVAALPGVGLDRLMGWYREAIAQEYRFYSYGDAMLVV